WLYSHLERWHYLSFLRSKETLHLLKTLPAQSDAPEKLQALYDLVNEDLGYRLHQSVQRTKRELSGAETAAFRFSEGSVDIGATVRRADFEEWIAGDLAAIAACVDRLGSRGVDRVFLTGGTSFVPAVRRIFAERFGAERIESGNEFSSIAHGLALGG
ncbi:MAG: Hsp70 family protein, partial [Acidobacteriota bacterium]